MIHHPKHVTGSTPAPDPQPVTRKGAGQTRMAGILAVLLLVPCTARALQPVDLGAAAPFTILAGAAITTTGGGIIHGDVGASPITGNAIKLTAEQVDGTIYTVDATGPAGSTIDAGYLTTAKGALTAAYNDAAGRTPIPSGPFLNPGLPGNPGNMGGMTLVPGIYKFTSTAYITAGDLTLAGGPDDVWIFQIASDLQVGTNTKVILTGGALPRNIFWQVGTSAVIETFAVFKGIILADQSIVMKTSSTMEGKALAFSAGVTFNGTVGILPDPAIPHFTAISRNTAGDVTLTVATTPYFPLTLETSVDLSVGSWERVITETPTTTPWTHTQPAADATGPKRFYRAFLTPY
ncbi:MAG: ice-binding family protein [Luteolibacter sp.]